MTSIFAYPLKNAWVIVADRLETDIHETIRATKGYEVFPHRFTKKVEVKNNWVLGFAGDSSNITLIKDIFYANLNTKLQFKRVYTIIRRRYQNLSEIDVSCILLNIHSLKCYKIVFANMFSDKLRDYEIKSIEKGFIGSGKGTVLASNDEIRRGNFILSQLNELKSYELKRNFKHIIKHSVNTLNNISLIDFQFTGSPYIYGCDVVICKKNKVKSFEIIPNGYLYRANQDKWRMVPRI